VTRNDVSVGDQGKECEDSEERMCVDEERLERKKERFGETVERKDWVGVDVEKKRKKKGGGGDDDDEDWRWSWQVVTKFEIDEVWRNWRNDEEEKLKLTVVARGPPGEKTRRRWKKRDPGRSETW
jgi:hypothetical protein